MNKEMATKVFESLASGIRLEVWRLLVKAGLEGRVAGELAGELTATARAQLERLLDAEVPLRGRGGATRTKKK